MAGTAPEGRRKASISSPNPRLQITARSNQPTWGYGLPEMNAVRELYSRSFLGQAQRFAGGQMLRCVYRIPRYFDSRQDSILLPNKDPA